LDSVNQNDHSMIHPHKTNVGTALIQSMYNTIYIWNFGLILTKEQSVFKFIEIVCHQDQRIKVFLREQNWNTIRIPLKS